jgi:oligosaccharide repeat unit polymerase
MIDFLIVLILLSLIFFTVLLYRQVQNFIVFLIGPVQAIYLVIAPFIYQHYSIHSTYLMQYPVTSKHLMIYLYGGLIFIWVYYPAVLFFTKKKIKPLDSVYEILNFDRVSWLRLVFMIVVCGAVSYVCSVQKFGDLLYMFQKHNQFEVTMSLVRGNWFINVLGGLVTYTLFIFIGKCQKSPRKGIVSVFAAMAFYIVFLSPSGRTWALMMVISWAAFHFGKIKMKRIPVYILMGAATLFLLVILAYMRQGRSFGSSAVDINIFSFLTDFLQFDNSMILIQYFEGHEYYFFRYLLGAITPLVLIPSKVFPWKLPADKEANLTQDIFGSKLSAQYYHEGSTVSFTVPFSGYADCGMLGLIVASLLFAFITAFWLKGMKKSNTVKYISITGLIYVALGGYRLGAEGHVMQLYTDLLFYFFNFVLARAVIFRKTCRGEENLKVPILTTQAEPFH